jgi:hypothetical protein
MGVTNQGLRVMASLPALACISTLIISLDEGVADAEQFDGAEIAQPAWAQQQRITRRRLRRCGSCLH